MGSKIKAFMALGLIPELDQIVYLVRGVGVEPQRKGLSGMTKWLTPSAVEFKYYVSYCCAVSSLDLHVCV